MASPKAALLHALGQLSRTRYAASFSLSTENPERTQRNKLADILARNRGTEYGKKYRFGETRTPREYARRVPLMTAADLEPYVSLEMDGERNLLTAEAPVSYVRTTGSTGAPKHIPITPSYRAELQRTMHVALWHLYARFPEAFLSKALYFVGSRRVDKARDGNDVGTMSGLHFTELPPLVRAVYAWPYELSEVKDLKTRSYLALWLASLGDPSLIADTFPSPIVYLLRDLSAHAAELADDVRSGRLPPWLKLEPEQRAVFERFVSPRPDVAERLERAAGAPEEQKVAEAWPSLSLVSCWTTAAAAIYLPELRRRVGNVPIRDAIYSACEGWCAIPIGDEEPGGALAIESVYFEFIPEEAFERGSRDTLAAWELENGRRYFIVLTTSAGLYRYLLGDIVEVCGFHNATPRIRFVRRRGATSNLAGEKLEEGHVNHAVGAALRALGLDATFFALAPDLSGPTPGYTLYFEPARPLSPAQAEALRSRVDEALGHASFDYGRLRAAAQLAPLSLRLLEPGSYDAHRQLQVAAGSAESQLKTAHLVTDASMLPPARRSAA